jgi:hypothetical protein
MTANWRVAGELALAAQQQDGEVARQASSDRGLSGCICGTDF